LLAASPEGIKYRYALEWGIHCVTTQWFFDSINAYRCMDERLYLVPMTDEKRDALFSPTSTSITDIARLSPALRRRHLHELQQPQPPLPQSSMKTSHPPSSSRLISYTTSADTVQRAIEEGAMDVAPSGTQRGAVFNVAGPRRVLEHLHSLTDQIITAYKRLEAREPATVANFLQQLREKEEQGEKEEKQPPDFNT